MECGRHLLLRRRILQQVSRDLFDRELIEGLVFVERANPRPERPKFRAGVIRITCRVRISS